MKLKNILISWDAFVAALALVALSAATEGTLKTDFCKDLYGIGISVLSIVFSLYAAALALLMASPDDDFVRFLQKDGSYSELIHSFRFVLVALFLALAISIAWYGSSAYWVSMVGAARAVQSRWWLISFATASIYALTATLCSMLDSINYARHRAEFLEVPAAGQGGHKGGRAH